MLSPFERLLALRYLRAKRAEGFLSLVTAVSFIGILVGVGALVLVIAVMAGFRTNLVDQILAMNGHITIEGSEAAIAEGDPVVEALLAQTGNIDEVHRLVEDQALVSAPSGAAVGTIAKGVTLEQLQSGSRFFSSMISGTVEDLQGWDVFVSRRLALKLDVGVGSRVDLISPKGNVTPMGWTPRIKLVTVAGVVEVPRDQGTLYLTLPKAQIFFRSKGAYTRIELVTQDPAQIDAMTARLAAELGDGYRVQNWKDFNRVFVGALDVERVVMFIILTLVVVVAAFNIVAGQSMLVRDKARSIAVLRSMGAQAGSILRIFIATGAAIGVAGTLIGGLVGLLLALNFEGIINALLASPIGPAIAPEVQWLTDLTPVVNPVTVAITFLLGIGLSILATLYPAWNATRIEPVEALRYE